MYSKLSSPKLQPFCSSLNKIKRKCRASSTSAITQEGSLRRISEVSDKDEVTWWMAGTIDLNTLRPTLKFVTKGQINNIGSHNGLVPARRRAIVWTHAGQATSYGLNRWSLVYWCKYALLEPNELTHCPLGDQVNAAMSHWWLVNIGSSNGFVPSGN